MMRRTRVFLTMALASLLVLTSTGCGRYEQPPRTIPAPQPTTGTPPPSEPSTTTVRVYLVRGERIGVGGRVVEATNDTQKLAFAAMDGLLAGPTAEEKEFGLGTCVPDDTKVNSVTIANGTATVDMSSRFQSGGGSLSMLLRVAQVICTLTQFDGVDKVAFALDGKKAEAIGGEGVIVDPPVGRADFEGQLPPVLIEQPYPGETVESPLTASGSSNVFEAVHQLQLTDPEGRIIYNKPVHASSGTGTRGTWSATIDFTTPRDGMGEVIVFEYSAKDGKRIDIVEVPVRLTK